MMQGTMHFGRALSLVLAFAMVAACAPRGPTFGFQRNEDESRRLAGEYAPYRQKGFGMIAGRAFVHTPSGRSVIAVHQAVELTPVTTLSQQAVDEGMRSGDWSGANLARQHAVVWSTRTDEQGRFDFNGLPPGEYFVICRFPWSDGGSSGETILVGRTHLAQYEQKDVVLTGTVTAPVQ